MARTRQIIPLSYDPSNADAVRVMAALRQAPAGQRSATIWHWLAAYLDGDARIAEQEDEIDDETDSLLDNL